LAGRDQVKSFFRTWAETSQCVFYAENETVAVADNFTASYVTVQQQVSGETLKGNKLLMHLPHAIADRFEKGARGEGPQG
jgi:hypothetical protein